MYVKKSRNEKEMSTHFQTVSMKYILNDNTMFIMVESLKLAHNSLVINQNK